MLLSPLNIIELMKKDPTVKSKNNDIAFNKFYNALAHKANEMGLLSKCRLCGKDIVGRKNSHSVPQSVLKNINNNGHYCQITCAIEDNLIFGPIGRLDRTGLNKTGTFHLLCEECENKFFRDYEDPIFLDSLAHVKVGLLKDDILAEIMLKCALRERYKKEFSKNISILVNQTAKLNNIPYNISTTADELNVKEYDFYINVCLDILSSKRTNQFTIIYYDVLDYKSSFASQSLVAIQKTVTNLLINDVYNYDPSYKINLCNFIIFPLEEKTICAIFCLKNEEDRLRPFINYFNSLNLVSKRKLFQSTLFMYTEEVYTNEEMINEIKNDHYTLSFVKSAMENAVTTNRLKELNKFLVKPPLVAPNGFRKAKFLI